MPIATRVQNQDETGFPMALIILGNVWIKSFSLQLWVNNRVYLTLWTWYSNRFRRRKTLTSNLLNSTLKVDLVSYPARLEGLGKHTNMYEYSRGKKSWLLHASKENCFEKTFFFSLSIYIYNDSRLCNSPKRYCLTKDINKSTFSLLLAGDFYSWSSL